MNTPATKTMRRWSMYAFFGLNSLVVVLFWWHGSGPEALHSAAGLVRALGRISGLLGAQAIVFEFLTMARLPIMEQAFGRVAQTKLHKWFGYAAFVLIYLHFVLLTIGYAAPIHAGLVHQFLDFTFNYEDVLNSVIAIVLLTVVVGLSISFARRRVTHETWYYVHLLSYGAILLAFQHQLKVGVDFITQPLFVDYWWAMYLGLFGVVAVYRFFWPVWRSWQHRLVVDRVVIETSSSYSIFIKGQDLAKLKFDGGQFAVWRFLDPKLWWWQGHPFSISNLPGQAELRITVKATGDFTDRLKGVTPGAPVIMDGPYGQFSAKYMTLPKVLLIAGGIGVTPFPPMALDALAAGRDTQMIYAARTENDLALKDELETAVTQGLKLSYILSDQPNYQGHRGQLDAALLQQLVPDVTSREVFLCGPPPMMSALTKALISLGVDPKRIYTEEFAF